MELNRWSDTAPRDGIAGQSRIAIDPVCARWVAPPSVPRLVPIEIGRRNPEVLMAKATSTVFITVLVLNMSYDKLQSLLPQ